MQTQNDTPHMHTIQYFFSVIKEFISYIFNDVNLVTLVGAIILYVIPVKYAVMSAEGFLTIAYKVAVGAFVILYNADRTLPAIKRFYAMYKTWRVSRKNNRKKK